MEKLQVAVYGAGGFGREVSWLAESVAVEGCKLKVVCFIDDDESLQGTSLNNLNVLTLHETREIYPNAYVVSGIGVPKLRELTMEKAHTAGFAFLTLVHPRTEMSKWIEIGEGTVICMGSILTTNITIGKHVQINLDCTIGHDVSMEDYATLAPGVHVSGCVHMGKRVYIGTGANVINGSKGKPIVIGQDAVIGAGACVTQSIPPGETWVGVPARPVVKK